MYDTTIYLNVADINLEGRRELAMEEPAIIVTEVR